MSNLSDAELQSLIATLKEDLEQFPEGMNSLDVELESASKHVPAYVKIVKGHIEQLREVLQLENHNRRTLESVGLAKPVQQLMTMFQKLHDEDIQLLEELAFAARNWQPEIVTETASTTTEETTTS